MFLDSVSPPPPLKGEEGGFSVSCNKNVRVAQIISFVKRFEKKSENIKNRA